MISRLIKNVMQETGLNQVRLAEVIGASLSRVKAITSGRVQKLTREESEALVKKLNIRAEWLVTGEGPMFQAPGEREFQRRLGTVAQAARQAVAAGLTPGQADVFQRVLLASQAGDTATLAKLLRDSLSADEAALLDSYRRCREEDRQAMARTAAALAQQAEPKARPRQPKTAVVRDTEYKGKRTGPQILSTEYKGKRTGPTIVGQEAKASPKKKKDEAS